MKDALMALARELLTLAAADEIVAVAVAVQRADGSHWVQAAHRADGRAGGDVLDAEEADA